jgi:hypothetical protein
MSVQCSKQLSFYVMGAHYYHRYQLTILEPSQECYRSYINSLTSLRWYWMHLLIIMLIKGLVAGGRMIEQLW